MCAAVVGAYIAELVNAFASNSVCSLPRFIHKSKQVPTLIICADKSDDTRKVCCLRCCLDMLCDLPDLLILDCINV